jgi:hypothetical protein
MNPNNFEKKEFYTVLSISHIDSGSERILRLVTNNDDCLINSNTVFDYDNAISLKLFHLTIPRNEDEYQPDRLFKDLVNFFKFISGGVDLILISFPVNIIRLDAFWIRQVFRILRIGCKENILGLITNLDLHHQLC